MDNTHELVQRARGGDREALSELLSRLEPVFRRFFSSRLPGSAEIDDLTQNSLMRMQRGIADLRDASSLRAFAFSAARFELQDYFRGRYSLRETLIEVLPEELHKQSLPREDEALDVEKALQQLTPQARRVLELREQGFRYQEIADQTGSTEAAVKMQVRRAFEKLREWLQTDAGKARQ